MKERIKEITFLFLILFVLACSKISFAEEVTQFLWDSPTTNEDGTPLTDLDGFKLYCGTTPTGPYDGASADVGSVNSYSISSILSGADGLYYCMVTAYDVWGNKSGYSNEVETLKRGIKFYSRDTVAPDSPFNLRNN